MSTNNSRKAVYFNVSIIKTKLKIVKKKKNKDTGKEEEQPKCPQITAEKLFILTYLS